VEPRLETFTFSHTTGHLLCNALSLDGEKLLEACRACNRWSAKTKPSACAVNSRQTAFLLTANKNNDKKLSMRSS
jgi:hypothetical protein